MTADGHAQDAVMQPRAGVADPGNALDRVRRADEGERRALADVFSGSLASRRSAAGLSQDELAARCFTKEGQISKLECGRALPGLVMLLLLAEALATPVATLVEDLRAPSRKAGQAQILQTIAAYPGRSIEDLSALAGLPDRHVFPVLRYLKATAQVYRDDTGWHAVTPDAGRDA